MTEILSPFETGLLIQCCNREHPDQFLTGASWLGGLPALGKQEWPKATDGRLLFHVATIDCVEANAAADPNGTLRAQHGVPLFPEQGQLAFFVDGSKHGGKVLYIERPAPSTEPVGLDENAISYDLPNENSTVYPRWPISLSVLPHVEYPSEIEDMSERFFAFEKMRLQAAESIAGPSTSGNLFWNCRDLLPRQQDAGVWDSVFRLASALDASPENLKNCRQSLKKLIEQGKEEVQRGSIYADRKSQAERFLQSAQAMIGAYPTEWVDFKDSVNLLRERLFYEQDARNRIPAKDLNWFHGVLGEIQKILSDAEKERDARFEDSVQKRREKIEKLTNQNSNALEFKKRRIATYERRLESLLVDWEAYKNLVSEVEQRLVGRKRWDKMSDEDHDWFKGVIARVQSEKKRVLDREKGEHYEIFSLGGSRYSTNPERVFKDTFAAMVSGPPEIFTRLPEVVQSKVAKECHLVANGYWHQMFGHYTEIQDEGLSDKLLLLQLASDPLLGFVFGDAGKLAFWISLDDLIARRFEKAKVTIAGH